MTRNVRGEREITVEIAALRGKGYPVPVGGGFETAQKGKEAATEAKKAKRR